MVADCICGEKYHAQNCIWSAFCTFIYYVCITFEVFIWYKMLLNNFNIVCKWNDNYDVWDVGCHMNPTNDNYTCKCACTLSDGSNIR